MTKEDDHLLSSFSLVTITSSSKQYIVELNHSSLYLVSTERFYVIMKLTQSKWPFKAEKNTLLYSGVMKIKPSISFTCFDH